MKNPANKKKWIVDEPAATVVRKFMICVPTEKDQCR